MEDNKITIPTMFEFLKDWNVVRATYGKEVIFIVPMETINLQKHLNEFLNDNPDAAIINQTDKSYTYEEQRNFVSDVVCQHPSKKILVLTHSPVVLSDAFACQIYVWRYDEYLHENRFKYIGSTATFGASPCRIAITAFNVSTSIGSLSDRVLHEWLNRSWGKTDIPELENICGNIGGGWPQAKLQGILDRLKEEGV